MTMFINILKWPSFRAAIFLYYIAKEKSLIDENAYSLIMLVAAIIDRTKKSGFCEKG